MSMSVNDQIVDWITARASTQFKDDISLVLIYGSYVNGTANSKSDVDCYFIPKTDRGYGFCNTFILNGIGYDIFPMSWERVERIADLQDTLLPCVGDVQMIYANSDEDVERFKKLQERMKMNLLDKQLSKKAAEDRFRTASELVARMVHAGKLGAVRNYAGNILMLLADAAALYHHTYFHKGLKQQFQDLQIINGLPSDLTDEYLQVIQASTIEDIITSTHAMFMSVKNHLQTTIEIPMTPHIIEKTSAGEQAVDYASLASLYEEIVSTFNKIYVCYESGNDVLAFLSAVCLQNVLEDVCRESGLPAYDLLEAYQYDDLSLLVRRAEQIEADLVHRITVGGGKIKRYESFAAFEAAHQ